MCIWATHLWRLCIYLAPAVRLPWGKDTVPPPWSARCLFLPLVTSLYVSARHSNVCLSKTESAAHCKTRAYVCFFVSENITFIQQGCIKCFKVTISKTFQFQINAVLLAAQLIIRNVSWTANQHIRLISEGSRDTEDWSNDAKALHHRNNKKIKICYNKKNSYFK